MKTIQQRIEEKYIPVPFSGCWIWTGSTTLQGYGQIWIKPKMVLTHVYLWEQINGPKPNGMDLDHFACDTSFCVNPLHVKPVSHRDNMLRGKNNACAVNHRRTHCVNGHEFVGENLIILYDGRRVCRACRVTHNKLIELKRQAGIYT